MLFEVTDQWALAGRGTVLVTDRTLSNPGEWRLERGQWLELRHPKKGSKRIRMRDAHFPRKLPIEDSPLTIVRDFLRDEWVGAEIWQVEKSDATD